MSAITTSYIPSTSGVEVAVHDLGGTGRLLLLCHATGFCGHVWLPMAEALRPFFHCVALDFRGHGQTRTPDGVSMAWSGMAEDLQAVIDRWSPEDPVWAVGHSMGGTAIVLAETARPGTVERAWTYEPIMLRSGPELTGDAAPAIADAARRRRGRFASRDDARQRYASRPPLDRLDPRALDAYLHYGMVDTDDGDVELRCRPEVEASVFEHHMAGGFEASGHLGMPTVFAAGGDRSGVADAGGGEDVGTPAEWTISAAQAHPHLTLSIYPDLTHFGPLEEPDRLAVDVVRFFLGEEGVDG